MLNCIRLQLIMKRDIGDIVDRWSIAKLKSERIKSEESKKEFAAFDIELKECFDRLSNINIKQFSEMMLKINDFIWQLEAGLKSGKEKLVNPCYIFDPENDATLAKIGTATILIRNFNSLRVDLKNMINSLAGEGFQDKKQNHLSQENGKLN